MKKNSVQGLLILLLWAVLLSVFVEALAHGQGFRLDLGHMFRMIGLTLALLAVAAALFASKGRRLRMALTLAVGAAAGILLSRLNLSTGMQVLVFVAIVALYLLACALSGYFQLRRALRPLNEAALAYQQDHDGGKFLEALDRCAPNFPKGAIIIKPGVGTITMQEHIVCEKIEVLGSMGRLEERRAVLEQLRRETENAALAAWLDQKAAEFDISQDDTI